ncbi:YitT family protein [Liquorilactobacillus oeni]|nr:YitT family protein [Liquorilactobacillus oeni]
MQGLWNLKDNKTFWEYAGIALGTLVYTISLNYFLLPTRLGEGGVVGLTTMFYYTLGIPLYLTNFILNGILIVVGYRFLGKKTVIRSLWAIVCLTVFLKFPVIAVYHTDQTVIPTMVSGVLTGISMGIILRCGGTIAGSTILAKIANRYLGVQTGSATLFFDLGVAAPMVFIIGFQNTLLTILQLYIAAVLTNQFLARVGAKKAIFIISDSHESIAASLSNELHQGITVFKGRGFYSGKEQTMLYLVCTSPQLTKVVPIVESVDAKALIVVEHVRSVRGLQMHQLL